MQAGMRCDYDYDYDYDYDEEQGGIWQSDAGWKTRG
jgi:hypothetical protein